MKNFPFFSLVFLFCFSACSQNSENLNKVITRNDLLLNDQSFAMDCSIYNEGWDQLNNIAFWQEVIALNKDSAIVNIAQTRTKLFKLNLEEWHQHSEAEKEVLRKEIREKYQIPDSLNLYFTSGKREYYLLDSAIKILPEAKKVFNDQNVDPWYAQAILLIESPGLNRKSPVGAYGPFQLMKEIAKSYGLQVTSLKDEREDVSKSAYAASRLIKEVCVPKIKNYLNEQLAKEFSEDDLWFKLLVMHAYHAGSGNVIGALKKIKPTQGGMALIQELWKTNYRGFQNASQNYSQLILATQLIMDHKIQKEYIISSL